MAKGFKGLKPKTGNTDSLRLEELFDQQKFPDDKWLQLRFIDKVDPLVVKQHWIKILGGKDKREITIPKFCIAFDPMDPETPKEGVHCPYCDLSSGKDGAQRASEFFLVNAIVRDIQEEEPAKKSKHTAEESKTGFKDMRSKSWTPVRVIRLPGTVVARIQELGETNVHKDKKTKEKHQYDASHPKFGFDVQIKYKPKAAGTDKYSCDKVDGGPTPLTSEEKEYLVYRLDEGLLDMAGRENEKRAMENFKRMEIVGDIPDDDDDDDEPKGKKSKKKGRSLDDDDDDDDEIPSNKKKGKKSKPFEDDDEDDDDDDEDDEPKKSSKKSKLKDKKKSSKKSRDDDDDDDDEDDEDDKPKKSSKKSKDKSSSKKSKKSKDDDDDDDDDEDDKPKKSSKSKSKDKVKSKDKAKKKKSSDDDDDEDEDDEPKKKKSSKDKDKKKSKDKSSGKKKKKASAINDDDDDE